MDKSYNDIEVFYMKDNISPCPETDSCEILDKFLKSEFEPDDDFYYDRINKTRKEIKDKEETINNLYLSIHLLLDDISYLESTIKSDYDEVCKLPPNKCKRWL